VKEVIIESVIAGFLFLVFLITLVLVILKKRRRKILLISAIALMATVGTVIYTAYTVTNKAVHKVGAVMKPRTGEEIYNALLGVPEANCVKVLNYLDQTIPVIDFAIVLHFETCPQELSRLILKRKFSVRREKSSSELIQTGVAIDWSRTDVLGDSINVFTALNPDASGQIIYSSLDSTKVMLVNYSN
jgi:hypothetical protein